PVHDCGCFGDAVVISNWATFWKNVVLVVLIALIFIFLNTYRCRLTKTCQWIIEGFTVLCALGLAGYCYRTLPIVDFRPYHIGADIRKGMEIPEDAEQDVYDTKLIYEKNGVQKDSPSTIILRTIPHGASWTRSRCL
ncbi:MAG: DoxX family protein, partial [Paludibacteraceae bacterium]|nr:DoxX family protein [Paludibacteraceae bacterium]